MDTLTAKEIAMELREQGRDVCDAGLGENQRSPPKKLVRFLKKYADRKEYTSLHGVSGLSEALKRYMNPWKYFIFGNGLKELLFVTQLAFKGTIIHITPSWVSYYKQLRLLDKTPVEIRTTFESCWKVTGEQLEECFQRIDGPKMLLFNNPNNPTGICYTPDEVTILGRMCHRFGVIVLADEIYGQITFDDSFVSIGVHTTTIRASSISKDLGCGGYKLGWLAFPNELEDFMQNVKSVAKTIYSAPAAPIQYAFRDYLNLSDQNYGLQCKETCLFYKQLCDRICLKLSQTELKFIPTQAAWYVFVSFENYTIELASNKIQNDSQLALVLLNELNLVTLPGLSFRCFDLYCLRFSLVDIHNIDAGIDRLVSWLNELKCTYKSKNTKKNE